MRKLTAMLLLAGLAALAVGCGGSEPEPEPKAEAKIDWTQYAEHSNKGEYDAALMELDKIIAKNPDNQNAHAQRGTVLCELQRFEEAIEEFNWLLDRDIDPDYSGSVYYFKGAAYAALGREADAIEAFEKAAQGCKDYIGRTSDGSMVRSARTKGAVYLYLAGHKSEALEMIDKALEATGTDHHMHEVLLKTKEAIESDERSFFIPECFNREKDEEPLRQPDQPYQPHRDPTPDQSYQPRRAPGAE